MAPTVGVLALQGGFAKHAVMLRALGVVACLVRVPSQLRECDALVIPGGESTTMMKLMASNGGWDCALREFSAERAVFGTCAGMILMAAEVRGGARGLGLIDMVVERNAYGRQLDSFVDDIAVIGEGGSRHFRATFIRAPQVCAVGSGVEVLANYDGRPVLLRQGQQLAASFHPELGDDVAIHALFLEMSGLVTADAL